jgi:hypothetical protein
MRFDELKFGEKFKQSPDVYGSPYEDVYQKVLTEHYVGGLNLKNFRVVEFYDYTPVEKV